MEPTPKTTAADRELLRFLALHRATTASQVPVLLRVTSRRASERLRRLEDARMLRREWIFARRPATLTITARGLREIGSDAEATTPSLTEYRHDLGVSWLWLAARDGAFGPLRAMATERELRGSSPRPTGAEPLADVGRHPGEQHRPDLLLTTESGKRIAVELELTPKGASRLEGIMLGFAGDPGIDAVLYLVPDPALARLIGRAAQRAGISDMVHVQRLAPDSIHGAPATGAAAAHARGDVAERAQGGSAPGRASAAGTATGASGASGARRAGGAAGRAAANARDGGGAER